MEQQIAEWAARGEPFQLIGLVGAGVYIVTYVCLTLGWLDARRMPYFMCNLSAASLVLVGLVNAFNPASAVIQVFFIGVSLVGLWRCARRGGATDGIAVERPANAGKPPGARITRARPHPAPEQGPARAADGAPARRGRGAGGRAPAWRAPAGSPRPRSTG